MRSDYTETKDQRVAVIGGGLTGCEIAYELALKGAQPIIIEMKSDLIAQRGVCLANSSYLREWFALQKVPVYLDTTLQKVEADKVICRGANGEKLEIPCDKVVSSVGYRSAPLAPAGKQVYQIGDCRQVGNVRTVVWDAYAAAMKI